MNNPFQQYRNKQISSGSDSETKGPARTSTPKRVHANMPSAVNMTFSLEQMTVTIQAAVAHAVEEATLESQRRENELRQAIQQLTAQVNAVQIAPAQAEAPQIKAYEPIDIKNNVKCDEPLDPVKCLPEFTGAQDAYVSWRQAAVAAYYIFRNYVDSSRHYQAVIIISQCCLRSALC